jgi:hypothetical protein
VKLFSKPSRPGSHLAFRSLCGVEYPHPALERGWLHGRELKRAWHVERIAEKIGERCWLSHYSADQSASDDSGRQRLFALAGFWPSGGFVELLMQQANLLEDHPRGVLGVYAESPAKCAALFAELLAGYTRDESSAAGSPRIGLLNEGYDGLELKRIPVTADQTVARDLAPVYYGDNVAPWLDHWLAQLNGRRYGLTVLTGAPGTGKTTLLRSLAHWLAETHLFYFMPAARFTRVESGTVVSFWAEENRTSKLRKVLILEDAESVLLRRGEDNREKVASLLNLTDGMLGDALGLHVICTLNCELADLDPALLRPGRLVAHRDFAALPLAEARRLATHLQRPLPEAPATLAEIVNPGERVAATATPRRSLGFHTALVTT